MDGCGLSAPCGQAGRALPASELRARAAGPRPTPTPPRPRHPARRWLREPTWEAELEFWERVCTRCRVILTPGKVSGRLLAVLLHRGQRGGRAGGVHTPAPMPGLRTTLHPPISPTRAPLQDCHAAEPGFFRICFAWMRPDALPEAIRRMRLLMSGALDGVAAGSGCSLQ